MAKAMSPHPNLPGNNISSQNIHIHRFEKDKVKIRWGAVAEFKRFYNLVSTSPIFICFIPEKI
jgi:hypothetical protein